MEKQNEAREKLTLCDECPRVAEVFIGGKAYCGLHVPQRGEKQAEANQPLKSASPSLEDKHKP